MSQPDIFFASLWVFPTVWLFWLSCLATSSLCIGFVKNMSAGCALGLVGLARVTWSHYHCWLRWFSPSFCGLFLCYHYDWSGFHLLTHAWVFTDLTGCFLNLKKKNLIGFSQIIAWVFTDDCMDYYHRLLCWFQVQVYCSIPTSDRAWTGARNRRHCPCSQTSRGWMVQGHTGTNIQDRAFSREFCRKVRLKTFVFLFVCMCVPTNQRFVWGNRVCFVVHIYMLIFTCDPSFNVRFCQIYLVAF